MEREVEVAPEIGEPFFLYWNERGGVPEASVVKETGLPGLTVWGVGC